MVGTERFSKSLAAPSKWPTAKSQSALSAQRVRASETRLIAHTWISTARRLHSNMPKTSAARNPGPPLLSSCRCHRLVSVSRFLFKLVFSGSDYFRITDHPGETRLSGTPAATTRCLHDRRDCAGVPPHPAASHVARPVGGTRTPKCGCSWRAKLRPIRLAECSRGEPWLSSIAARIGPAEITPPGETIRTRIHSTHDCQKKS